MTRKCVVPIIFFIGATVVLTSLFQQYLTKDTVEKEKEINKKEYVSKELGVSFQYPENLSLSFEPRVSENGEIERAVSSVSLDQVLYLRSTDNFSLYQKGRLEGFKEEGLGSDDLVRNVEINGVKVEFKKYVFGDGSPSGGCLWSQDSISYIGQVKSLDMYVEIKTEKETTCDSEKEFIYKTDPERIKTALEVLKTIKKI